ncbi:MAG: DUF4430 domain-containing protein [Oscillospiraceae bacterium]
MEKKSSKKLIIIVAAVVVIIAAMLCVYFLTREEPVTGSKEISVEIIYDDVDKTVTISTDEEYLRGALEQESLIAGTESEWGLYITEVDGRVADDSKQEWWCITEGGVMTDTGVDATVIEDGDSFELTLTTGW